MVFGWGKLLWGGSGGKDAEPWGTLAAHGGGVTAVPAQSNLLPEERVGLAIPALLLHVS